MSEAKCPIVGIGASAGGLDALEILLEGMPATTGAAFVLVQHFDPRQKSLAAEILGRFTTMPTVQVEQWMRVEANRIYVIPPNTTLTLKDHVYDLAAPVLHQGIRKPIDAFLTSLAERNPERAVAIILSGSGSDGSLGVRAVRDAGGFTLAQSPETAEHDEMPRAAIATGKVDVVCPVEEMPDHLVRYLSSSYAQDLAGAATATDDEEEKILAILELVQRRTGADFRNYKRGTVRRRIARRMGLLQIDGLGGYLDHLQKNPEEADSVHRDLLISVTSFFRDPEAFEALDTQAIEPLIAAKGDEDGIRVWVPACASGEEAYSIAMLIFEGLERARKHCPVQIFATDLDTAALEAARNGVYAENEVANLSAERLRRFFRREDHTYSVRKPLREAITFAVQDVINDPPFSRLDLISCRNLLIYLNGDAHARVLGYFHFALREAGCLFLGHSETLGAQEPMFQPIDSKARLFRRKAVVLPAALRFPLGAGISRHPTQGAEVAAPLIEQSRLKEQVHQQLLHKFAPAAVLINAGNRVLYFFGPTHRYLRQPSGAPTQDVLNLVDDEMRPQLRALLRKVVAEETVIATEVLRVGQREHRREVRITITRTRIAGQPEDLFLVTFEDVPPVAKTKPPPESDMGAGAIRELQLELAAAREDLEAKIQALGAANEELQAANEEVRSVNEELQSTNEELETSKEELQSMNEELTTLNSQLKDKVEQLGGLNDDLGNFVASTEIATLFLDREKRIGRFTPASKRVFNLISTDVGRPLDDIRPKFRDPKFEEDIDRVLETLQGREREIITDDGSWYLRRILPYRTVEDRVAGVVITFFDITERRLGEQKLEASEARFRTFIENAPDPMIVVDEPGAITLANTQALRFFGYDGEQLVGMPVEALIPQACRARHREHRKAFAEQPAVRRMGVGIDLHARTREGEEVPVEVMLSPIPAEEGQGPLVIAAIRDVREVRHAVKDARDAKLVSDAALAAKSRFLATASHDLRQPLQSLATSNEALLKMVEAPAARRLLALQGSSIAGMRALLNSLLDVSKLDAGAVVPSMRPLRLGSIVDPVCEGLSAQARAKGLALKRDVQDVVVRSDPDLLRQLIQNVLVNAVDYTSRGAVSVHASRRGNQVQLSIKDTGPGIPAEEMPHIFEEFYRIEGSAPGNSGLGLGLAIVRRLADILKVGIDVASQVGVGTAFTLTLEASDDEPARERRPAEARAAAGSGIVFLVDDEPSVLESMQALISLEQGLEVMAAASPAEVYAALDRSTPDVIVTDMHLAARETGLDVIREVRRRTARDIPAVLLTGDTAGAGAIDGMANLSILTKPTEGGALIESVWRLLGAARPSGATGDGPDAAEARD